MLLLSLPRQPRQTQTVHNIILHMQTETGFRIESETGLENGIRFKSCLLALLRATCRGESIGVFIVAYKQQRRTSRCTEVLTTDISLERKGFQLMPERDAGCCWDDIVRQCIPAVGGGNWKDLLNLSSCIFSSCPAKIWNAQPNIVVSTFVLSHTVSQWSTVWKKEYSIEDGL